MAKHKYVVRAYQPIDPPWPFDSKGEREMVRIAYHSPTFASLRLARKYSCKLDAMYGDPILVAGRLKESRRRINEIRLLDEDYSAE